MEAGQQLVEVVGADGQHGGQADGRVHAVAAAYPVPEAEHIGGVDAERCNSFGVGRKRHEMPGNRRFIAQRVQHPTARRVGIGHGLQRGECLAGDDEQRLGRVQVVGCLGEIGGVHVADEAKSHVAPAVVAQRLVGHDRPQIGAADADVDHVADRLAGVAGPAPAAHLYRERGHALQDIVHLRHHVLAVHEDFGVQRRAQGHVQDSPVLGDVDLVAAEHGVDVVLQAARLGQRQQQVDGLAGDAVLGVVEVQPGSLHDHQPAAFGIVGEQVTQVGVADFIEMHLEVAPGGQGGQVLGHGGFSFSVCKNV